MFGRTEQLLGYSRSRYSSCANHGTRDSDYNPWRLTIKMITMIRNQDGGLAADARSQTAKWNYGSVINDCQNSKPHWWLGADTPVDNC